MYCVIIKHLPDADSVLHGKNTQVIGVDENLVYPCLPLGCSPTKWQTNNVSSTGGDGRA